MNNSVIKVNGYLHIFIKFAAWIKSWVRYFKHPNPCCRYVDNNRETFVVGFYAFTVCCGCGCESMPWRINDRQATKFHKNNPNAREKLHTIKETAKNKGRRWGGWN